VLNFSYFIQLYLVIFLNIFIECFESGASSRWTDRKCLKISCLSGFESGCAGALPSCATVRVHQRADFLRGVGGSFSFSKNPKYSQNEVWDGKIIENEGMVVSCTWGFIDLRVDRYWQRYGGHKLGSSVGLTCCNM
jgi:hypothetical protein